MVVRRTVVRGERETNQQIRVLNLNRRPNINSRPARLPLFNGRSSVAPRARERSPPPMFRGETGETTYAVRRTNVSL